MTSDGRCMHNCIHCIYLTPISQANIAFLPMKLFKRLQDDKDSEFDDGLRSYPRFLNLLGNKLDIVKEG